MALGVICASFCNLENNLRYIIVVIIFMNFWTFQEENKLLTTSLLHNRKHKINSTITKNSILVSSINKTISFQALDNSCKYLAFLRESNINSVSVLEIQLSADLPDKLELLRKK